MVCSLSGYTCFKMSPPWLMRTYFTVGFTGCILFLQEILSCAGLVHGSQASIYSIMVSSAVCSEISTVMPEALLVPPSSLTLVSDSYFLCYYHSHSCPHAATKDFDFVIVVHVISFDLWWLSTAEMAGTGWNQMYVAQDSARSLIRDKLTTRHC